MPILESSPLNLWRYGNGAWHSHCSQIEESILPYLGLHNARFCPDSLFCRRGAHYKQEQCVSLFFQIRNLNIYLPMLCYISYSLLNIWIQKKSWENDILKLKTINIFLFYSSLKKIIVLSRRNTLKTIKNIYA